jgi:ribonuclease BN (tRNA processing enzyme)
MSKMSDEMSNEGWFHPFKIFTAIGFGLMSFFLFKNKEKIILLEEKQKQKQKKMKETEEELFEIKRSNPFSSKETEDRLKTYEGRVTLLEEKVSALASHEKRISSLAGRISEMQDHGQRLFQVEHRSVNHQTEILNIDKRLEEIEKIISDLENKQENQNQRIQKIEIGKPVYTFFPGRKENDSF